MKKALYMMLLAVMGCGQANDAASGPLNVKQYLAKQGWSEHESIRQINSPVASVAPVVYEAKGAKAPSCGLLTGPATAPLFIDVWGPEEGSDWPKCLGFNDVAGFKIDGRDYLVFEYINQDTQDETYRRFFYLVKDASGKFVAAEEFNTSKNAPKMSRLLSDTNVQGAKEGVSLARSINVSKSLGDVQLSHRDYLLDGSRSFALYQDKAKTKCTFIVDNGVAPVKAQHDSLPDAQGARCTEILASGKLEKNQKTYYIAMYKDVSQRHVAVFSVDKSQIITVEGQLSAALGKNPKLADMKSVKKALATAIG